METQSDPPSQAMAAPTGNSVSIRDVVSAEIEATIQAVRHASGGVVDLLPFVNSRYKSVSDCCI